MAKTKLSAAERMLVEVAMTEYQQAVDFAEQRKQARLGTVVQSHSEAKAGPYNFESDGKDFFLVYADEEVKDSDGGTGEGPNVTSIKRVRKPKTVPPAV